MKERERGASLFGPPSATDPMTVSKDRNQTVFLSRRFVAVTALLAACFAGTSIIRRSGAAGLVKPLESIPNHIDGWTSAGQQPLSDDVIRTLRATSYLSRSYRKNNMQIELFVAHYDRQEAGIAMHSPTNCLPGSGWEIWRRDVARLSVKGRQFDINNLLIRNTGTNLYLLYWYQSDTRIIANEYFQKLFLFQDTLFRARRSESIVRIALPENAEALRTGLEFGSAVAESLWDCMGTSAALKDNLSRFTINADLSRTFR